MMDSSSKQEPLYTQSDNDKSVEGQNDGMIRIRKHSLIIRLAVASTIVVIALALGLGLGLGLPARDRAAAAASSSAAVAQSNNDALRYFGTHSWGPEATSYRAAESAYLTTTVELVEYSISDLALLSGKPTSHALLTVTQLAVEATATGAEPQLQVVPQFYSSDTKPVFVTTTTYEAPSESGDFEYDEGAFKPEPHSHVNDEGQWVSDPVPEKYGAVDCPQSNSTQYIEPHTGAIFTKLCYSFLSINFKQVAVAVVGTVSLNECIRNCASKTFEDDNAYPYLGCNAVLYDANITRSGVIRGDANTGNCKLIALREQGTDDVTYMLGSLYRNPGDWAMAIAVRQGFIPNYTNLTEDFRLDG